MINIPEDEVTQMLQELWKVIENHPEECNCIDCMEYEILAFK